jgi:tRNA (guanine-N7-)-methyltransferase
MIELTPEPSRSLLVELSSILETLDPMRLFDRSGPLEVELGCGDGSFLLDYAAQHPSRRFLGVERLLGRIRKIDRQGRRRGLRNLRGIRIEARYLLEYLLPPVSVTALHVYFPDPWPKVRHARRRLVDEAFPALAARVLVPSGCVYLRTDADAYREQMQEAFKLAERFAFIPTPAELARVETDFEREFRASGKEVFRLAYRVGASTDRC